MKPRSRDAISTVRNFWHVKMAEEYVFPGNLNGCLPFFIPCNPRNPFESRFVISPHPAILYVIGLGAAPKVGPPVVEAVAVDVVDNLPFFRPCNFSMKKDEFSILGKACVRNRKLKNAPIFTVGQQPGVFFVEANGATGKIKVESLHPEILISGHGSRPGDSFDCSGTRDACGSTSHGGGTADSLDAAHREPYKLNAIACCSWNAQGQASLTAFVSKLRIISSFSNGVLFIGGIPYRLVDSELICLKSRNRESVDAQEHLAYAFATAILIKSLSSQLIAFLLGCSWLDICGLVSKVRNPNQVESLSDQLNYLKGIPHEGKNNRSHHAPPRPVVSLRQSQPDCRAASSWGKHRRSHDVNRVSSRGRFKQRQNPWLASISTEQNFRAIHRCNDLFIGAKWIQPKCKRDAKNPCPAIAAPQSHSPAGYAGSLWLAQSDQCAEDAFALMSDICVLFRSAAQVRPTGRKIRAKLFAGNRPAGLLVDRHRQILATGLTCVVGDVSKMGARGFATNGEVFALRNRQGHEVSFEVHAL